MATAVKTSPVDMGARKALELRAGDSVRVWQRVVDLKQQKPANNKEALVKNVRKQAFEGVILAVKHGAEAGATFTVRKVASGVGVEKIFPLYSPMIEDIEILRRARTRRAKLYFIRRKAARDVKRAMRRQLDLQPRNTDTKHTAPTEAVPQVAAETPQTETVAAAE